MVTALVMAGGVGVRMGSPTPKQFLLVAGKPVIIYTLEKLEKCDEIDAVLVVCVPDYRRFVEEQVEHFALKKVRWVTDGGDSFQESAKAGVVFLSRVLEDDDIVVMVMSVQPLITADVISDSIRVCKAHGNAIAGAEPIYNISPDEGGSSTSYTLKNGQRTLNLPWTFPLKTLVRAYEEAERRGVGLRSIEYTPTMMMDLGEKIYFSKDTSLNRIKLTTPDDVDLFEAYVQFKGINSNTKEG